MKSKPLVIIASARKHCDTRKFTEKVNITHCNYEHVYLELMNKDKDFSSSYKAYSN